MVARKVVISQLSRLPIPPPSQFLPPSFPSSLPYLPSFLSVCLCLCMVTNVRWCKCGGQRATCRTCFSFHQVGPRDEAQVGRQMPLPTEPSCWPSNKDVSLGGLPWMLIALLFFMTWMCIVRYGYVLCSAYEGQAEDHVLESLGGRGQSCVPDSVSEETLCCCRPP